MLGDLRKIRDAIVLLRAEVGTEPAKVGAVENVVAYWLRDAHYDLELCIGKVVAHDAGRDARNDGPDDGSPG